MPIPAVVSADWLLAHILDAGVRVLDASWYLPTAHRNPRQEFREGHIPGARIFSIDDTSDASSALPHTFPPAAQFGGVVAGLGISSGDHVVVYDASGTNFSAPRAWWMFRAFGHDGVSLLDGGFAAWTAVGGAVEAGDAPPISPGTFTATLRPGMIRSAAQVLDALHRGSAQIVDMRSRGRFEATEAEPREGVRGGHIPGSRNLPYPALVDARGLLRSPAELHELMEAAGIDVDRALIASCGSGVTACSLLLALHVLGVTDTALYDGSWTEWGQRPDLPAETGPAR